MSHLSPTLIEYIDFTLGERGNVTYTSRSVEENGNAKMLIAASFALGLDWTWSLSLQRYFQMQPSMSLLLEKRNSL